MSTGNHLTIRDYFDQVLVGGRAGRTIHSSKSLNSDGSAEFHRILISNQKQNSITPHQKRTTGLTIVDYLANPVRVKCQYARSGSATFFKKKAVEAEKSSEFSLNTPAKTPAATLTKPSDKQKKINPLTSSLSSPASDFSDDRVRIEKSVGRAARKYNLPPSLIKGIIKAESNFQVSAVSHAGAQGLMQLMPGTARELGVSNPFDIDQNIDGGSRYLRKMLDSFGNDVKTALAAYNAGPGAVIKYNGDVPYRETREYVDRVLRFAEQTA